MSPANFHEQIKRLKATFGESHYPEERVNLIWKFVEHEPIEWFKRACDFFISESRTSPLLPQFRENLYSNRPRKEKERSAEVKHHKSRLGPEFAREITSMLAKKMSGEISKQEFDSWRIVAQTAIDEAVKQGKSDERQVCIMCDDGGLIATEDFNGSIVAFRCKCSIGQKYSSKNFQDFQGVTV